MQDFVSSISLFFSGSLGRTGSEKSTLVVSIFRFVDPASGGRIIIDEIDILIYFWDTRFALSIVCNLFVINEISPSSSSSITLDICKQFCNTDKTLVDRKTRMQHSFRGV